MQTLEIFQKAKNGIDADNVKEIRARVKVNDIGFTLIETKEFDLVWYKDTQILNIQDKLQKLWKNTKVANYDKIFDEIQNLESQIT